MKIIKINASLYIRKFLKPNVKLPHVNLNHYNDILVHPTAADDFYGYVYDNLKRDKSIGAEVDFDNQISEGFDIPDRYVNIDFVQEQGEDKTTITQYAFFVEDVLVREENQDLIRVGKEASKIQGTKIYIPENNRVRETSTDDDIRERANKYSDDFHDDPHGISAEAFIAGSIWMRGKLLKVAKDWQPKSGQEVNHAPSEWIDCSDRLPENYTRVQTYYNHYGSHFFDVQNYPEEWENCITHWMPLPSPPSQQDKTI